MSPSKISVFAPGLIGGSVALASSHFFPKARLAVWTRRSESLPSLRAALPKAEVGTEPELAQSSDLVVLAAPPAVLPELVRAILPYLSPSTLVTDVSSVKVSGGNERRSPPPRQSALDWVPSHGRIREFGLGAARTGLFQNAPVIVTPNASTSSATTRDVSSFWQALGARILTMSPQSHDEQVARISHLPHLISSALVLAAGKKPLPLAGPGYRDTTRIAAGPSELWSEILLENRREILAALKDFRSSVDALASALDQENTQSLHKILDEAAEIRRNLSPSS